MKDYYRILMVHPEADAFIIKAAYRRLAQEFHPDVCADPSATERMAEVNEAYEVLIDGARRAEYDSVRSTGRVAVEEKQEPMPASWRHIMAADRLLDDIEERSQQLSSDGGSIGGRNLAATLYQECLNVIRHLEGLEGDEIEQEVICYMKASAHLTAGMVTLRRPGFRDVSSLCFGSSSFGSFATFLAWGVGTSGSHVQEKHNLSQALWHYQTSLGVSETTAGHMLCGLCLLDRHEPAQAVWHFQRVIELDPFGEAGIEASKELLRLGALGTHDRIVPGPPPRDPVVQTPPGSIATPHGLLTGAGFGLRVGAAFIDSVVTLLIYAFAIAFGALFGSPVFGVVFFLGGSFTYFAGMESSKHQGTLGKMALGLRVCNLKGEPISLGLAVAKHALRLVNTVCGILCIGYVGWLLVALTPRKQAVYELVVSTATVVGRPQVA